MVTMYYACNELFFADLKLNQDRPRGITVDIVRTEVYTPNRQSRVRMCVQ